MLINEMNRRLSELQHETAELRRKLRSSSTSDAQQSPISMLTVAAEIGVHGPNSGTDLPLTPQSHIVPPVSYHQRRTTPSNRDIEPSMTRTVGHNILVDYTPDPTESRVLNNIDVSGSEIDQLFELFVDVLNLCRLSKTNRVSKVLSAIFPFSAHIGSTDNAEHLLYAVSILILGNHWCWVQNLCRESNIAHGSCGWYHRQCIALGGVNTDSVANHPRSLVAVDLALS